MGASKPAAADQPLGPLQLAYLGDAVWELHVRQALLQSGSAKLDVLHRRAVKRVQAAAQAALLRLIEDCLTDNERGIVRRGRNAKSHVPRGIDASDYRCSTAFECLLGYLQFTGQSERLQELLHLADAAEPEGQDE